MLLKSVSYQDFRQFKGNQTIDLTPNLDNPDATVMVIIGNKTFGKSTFVLSFIWCLYGESRFNRPNDILNKKVEKSLEVGQTAVAWVEVVFEDGGKEYTMRRTQEFRKKEKGLKASESEATLVYVDESGQTQKVGPLQHDVNLTIKSILPQDLSAFFFFEGEKDNEIRKKDLGKAVRTLLGLEAFDRMRSHLFGSQALNTPYSKSVMGYYLKKQKSESGDKAQAEWDKKVAAEAELEKAVKRIAEIDNEIKKHEELIDEINSKLREAGPAQELQKRRDSIAKDRLRKLEAEDRELLARITQIGEIDLGNAEEDLLRYKKTISELRDERDTYVGIKTIKESEIETAINNFNMYKTKSQNAKQYQLYYRYAEEIYNWVNQNYSNKDEEMRVRLAAIVSKLFDNMYSGKRVVTIDNQYNIDMRTKDGDIVDLTGELRVIQYFAYVGGLVKLAYEIMCERQSKEDGVSVALGEQYPLVLDAAFSHVYDEHTHNIARELSDATNQLIFALMKKDWLYAKSGLVGKVGRMYELVKIDETEVRVDVYGGDQ